MDAALPDRDFDEALYHFRSLLRLDTSNPPGNEAGVVRYLSGILAGEGIPCEVVEPAPGRASLVARLSAGNPSDALLVSAHTDVVPAGDGWTHAPFGGDVADGFVWGRGALDMKHMVAYGLMALLLAKRRGLPLTRDLVFAAVADEEQGCGLGSLHLARTRPELLQASHCLTEAGGFPIEVGGRTLVPVQVATKGFAWVRVRARGAAGHGSLADADSAPSRLLKALSRVAGGLVEHRLCPSGVAFLDAVAGSVGMPQAALIHGLKIGGAAPWILKAIPDRDQARYFGAITHDTAALTMLRAGAKENVIPDAAEAVLDLRILPGRRVEEAVRTLAARLGDDVEIEVVAQGEATESAWPTPLWDRIVDAVGRARPGARVVPYLLSGFADVLAYAPLGITCYGFAPVALPPGLSLPRLVHAPDERIPVEGMRWGLSLFLDVVHGWCTAPAGGRS